MKLYSWMLFLTVAFLCSSSQIKHETAPIYSGSERLAIVAEISADVLICKSKAAYAYHRYRCQGLKRCRSSIEQVSLSEAKKLKYKACKNCYK